MPIIRTTIFVLGMALYAPSAVFGQESPATLLPDGITIYGVSPAYKLELSADQKLARAYALCERHIVSPCSPDATSCNAVCLSRPDSPCGGVYAIDGCNKIAEDWLASPAKKITDDQAKQAEDDRTAADRIFIREVARGLNARKDP